MLAKTLCISACMTLLGASTAQAYRNPDRFAAPVDEGGGGGKYFTLSRAEGYGCAVCHSQGTPVPVSILNLPTGGYLPGQTYRITIDWPDDMPSVALNVEMTDEAGAPFGQLTASDPATLSAADLCPRSDVSEPPTAAQTLPVDANARRVLLIAECGQSQTSFDWIAPATLANGYFSSSITFTNRDAKLGGDRVVDIVEPVTGARSQATNLYEGGCSVIERTRSRRAWAGVAACSMYAALLRRRVRRRRVRARSA